MLFTTSVKHGNESWRDLGAYAQGFFQGRPLYLCGLQYNRVSKKFGPTKGKNIDTSPVMTIKK
jgi:hypothetical protein